MRKIINRTIIWFFERYAFDYWVDIQQTEEREKFKIKYNLKDDEVEEAMIDLQQEPQKEAYDAGLNDGIERVLDNPSRYY